MVKKPRQDSTLLLLLYTAAPSLRRLLPPLRLHSKRAAWALLRSKNPKDSTHLPCACRICNPMPQACVATDPLPSTCSYFLSLLAEQNFQDPPLVVFPEGDINYGPIGELLPFKTGAFRAGEPVQPILLRYHTGQKSAPAGDIWSEIIQLARLLLNLSNACEVCRLAPFLSVLCSCASAQGSLLTFGAYAGRCG